MTKPQYLVINHPKPALIGLFDRITSAEAYQDANRPDILLRAERYLVGLGDAASEALLEAARTELVPPSPAPPDVPAFLKIHVRDTGIHDRLLERCRQTFGITRVKTDFLLRAVLLAYLIHLNAAPEPLPEVQAVDRFALNLQLARLLADSSPEAEQKLARISEILQEKEAN